MKQLLDKLQPAVRKETRNAAVHTIIGVVIMWAVFALLHVMSPEVIPFDWRVILAGAVGGAVAVLNFFLMALTVQTVVSIEDDTAARNRMKASYSQRMLMQGLWCVLAIVLPCFQFAAGMLPLLFPTLAIKLKTFWQQWGPKKA